MFITYGYTSQKGWRRLFRGSSRWDRRLLRGRFPDNGNWNLFGTSFGGDRTFLAADGCWRYLDAFYVSSFKKNNVSANNYFVALNTRNFFRNKRIFTLVRCVTLGRKCWTSEDELLVMMSASEVPFSFSPFVVDG